MVSVSDISVKLTEQTYQILKVFFRDPLSCNGSRQPVDR
jgi:hypothetical protein